MTPLEEMGKFKTVVVDPPWRLLATGLTAPIRGRTVSHYDPKRPYCMMGKDALYELPVDAVLEADAFLFLWTVNQHLREAWKLMEHWGCDYSFTMSWIKSKGPQLPGTPCFNTEWCLVGRKGKPQFLETRDFRTGNLWPWQGHSVKPEEFYDLLRRVTPGPRLDIFGRRRIAGFQSWGNEAPEGEASPDHYQQVLLEA